MSSFGRSTLGDVWKKKIWVLGTYQELGDYHEWVLVAYLERYLRVNNVQSMHVQNKMYDFVDVDSSKEYRVAYANIHKLKSAFSK